MCHFQNYKNYYFDNKYKNYYYKLNKVFSKSKKKKKKKSYITYIVSTLYIKLN